MVPEAEVILIYSIPFIALVLAAGGAWFMSRFAYKLGLIDIPNNRSSHILPTPSGGGIGILLAFTTVALLSRTALNIWIPVVFVSLVSFLDDKLGLTPKMRLLVQFVATFVAILPLIYSSPVEMQLKFLLIIFFSVFIVGTANFYNFMDGINGIAGLTGFVGFMLLFIFAVNHNYDAEAVLLLSVSCACLGFLPFNLPSARVFMGDVGSILLGFFYAITVVSMSSNIVEFLALSSCLFTFYTDALTTLFVRWYSGEKLSQAHRRHLYQLLANQKKIPHWKVSLGYATVQAVIGVICLELLIKYELQLYLFLGVTFMVYCILMIIIRNNMELKPS